MTRAGGLCCFHHGGGGAAGVVACQKASWQCVLGFYNARLSMGWPLIVHLQVIPMDNGNLTEAFNIRLEELHVIDMAFLHGCSVPTLAVLYEDTKHARHIKTYTVITKTKVCVGKRQPHAAGCCYWRAGMH